MSPRPGGDVSNSSEFAVMGSGEYVGLPRRTQSAVDVALRFLREHTWKALLLLYLALTIVARWDDVWFYRRFKVNIFYYSNPEDFFLAATRNPVVVLFFLVPTAILLLGAWVTSKRSGKQPRRSGKWNTPTTRLVAASILVVLTALILTGIRADRRADAVEAGIGRYVSFARNDGVTYDEKPLLLGSTGQFFFLYYVKRKVAEIVPVENTALMTVDLGRPNGA